VLLCPSIQGGESGAGDPPKERKLKKEEGGRKMSGIETDSVLGSVMERRCLDRFLRGGTDGCGGA